MTQRDHWVLPLKNKSQSSYEKLGLFRGDAPSLMASSSFPFHFPKMASSPKASNHLHSNGKRGLCSVCFLLGLDYPVLWVTVSTLMVSSNLEVSIHHYYLLSADTDIAPLCSLCPNPRPLPVHQDSDHFCFS